MDIFKDHKKRSKESQIKRALVSSIQTRIQRAQSNMKWFASLFNQKTQEILEIDDLPDNIEINKIREHFENMNIYKRLDGIGFDSKLVIQINGHIAFFLKKCKYQKQQHMIQRLIKKGMLSQEEFANFTTSKHDFGEFLKAKDYESDNEDDHNISQSYTSYNTDEVHDTRSYFIGYYRGDKSRDDDSDSELEEFKAKLLKKPLEMEQYLESNISEFPRVVRVVRKIALGKRHLVAQVVTNEGNALFGMGSNQWGQLGRDPFRHPFFDQLMQMRIRCLSLKGSTEKSYELQQVECGEHHTIALFKEITNI